MDLATITKEELAFKADFELEMKRNDYCHALVTYFDIEFSKCHKPVFFSTGKKKGDLATAYWFSFVFIGPHAAYTHWKQTVFYLKEDLVTSQGDKMTGRHITHTETHNTLSQKVALYLTELFRNLFSSAKQQEQEGFGY